MTTFSPNLFPTRGVRTLTSKETMQRAKAIADNLPETNAPTCSGQVFVGLFFDGTGNNLTADYREPLPCLHLQQLLRVDPASDVYLLRLADTQLLNAVNAVLTQPAHTRFRRRQWLI